MVTVWASGVPAARVTDVGRRRVTSQVVVVITPLKSVSEVIRPFASCTRDEASLSAIPDGSDPPTTASLPLVVP